LCIFYTVLSISPSHLPLNGQIIIWRKVQNTELLACAVSFQFRGDSKDSDGGSDNDGGGDEEDENNITNSLSPYSTEVLLTTIKEPTHD
jgi:hypothetical protein